MALKNWSLPSVVADTETDLLQIGVGKEGCIVSLIISNCETSSVLVAVTLTDGLNAVKGYVLPPATDIKAGTPYYLDSKVFMVAGDKLRVKANNNDVSFIAGGYES